VLLVPTALVFIEASVVMHAMDRVRQEIRLDQALQLFPVTGRGVIVAILDRGIDWRNDDFRNENGSTRIAYIFDLTDDSGASAPQNPYGHGTIYTRSQIDSALSGGAALPTRDAIGHGTTTTGIAAGSGLNSPNRKYRGVAPEATIISVKVTSDGAPAHNGEPAEAPFWDPARVPIAMQFVKDKAHELGLPCVMLLNVGSIGGPSDGTSEWSRWVDSMVEAGFLFVTGTGDDGGRDNRADATVPAGGDSDLDFLKDGQTPIYVEVWYPEDRRLDVRVRTPTGVFGPYTAPPTRVAFDSHVTAEFTYNHLGADVEYYGADNNKRLIWVRIDGPPGTYALELINRSSEGAKVDASLGGNPPAPTWPPFSRFLSHLSTGTIWDMSTAFMNIAPNSYVMRTDWVDIDGVHRVANLEGLTGELWHGSSVGPTRDGRWGVDVAAPGNTLFTTYNPRSYWATFRGNLVNDGGGLYGAASAVSAAAPIVTGVLALMLEIDPSLDAADAKDILQRTARADSFTGAVPNPRWGFGKLDAESALRETRRISSPTVVTADAVTPSVGAGPSQVFSATYSDSLGAVDLSFVYLRFSESLSGGLHSCIVRYNQSAGKLSLRDDAGAWLPGLALAGGGTLENSQCSIELNNSSATALGQTLTLNLSMTFKIAYAGSKNIYLSAVNIDGVTTDWQQRGTWTVGVTLGAVSITPNSGTGVSRTFSAVFTDSLGVTTDLRVARVRFGVSTAGACVVDYNAMTNMVRILDDAGTPGAFGPFSGTLANSQCTVDLVQSSATPSGTTLALSLKITFKAALIGPQPIFLRANGNFGAATTGWIARGTWDVNAAVQAISVTPNNGSGSTQTFTLAYSDAEGVVADLRVARVRFSGGSGPCVIDYNAMTNQVRMQNDLGEWGNFKSFGAGAINNNSQCSLNLVTSSATPIGTNLTLTLALTFKAAFAGAKTIDMRANSNVGSTTGWLQKGTWTNVPIVATVDAVSASPNAGTGAFKMFTLQYTDSLGATDLASARVRFATTNVGPGSCSVWYNANAANISLMDDAGAWGAAVPLGSGTLANSQCTVNVAATTATLNGNMLTLGLSVAFSGNFAGAKNTFMLAASAGGPSTGWLIRGAWSVPDALLRDDFSGSSLDSSTWFMPVGAGTFLGRTQLRPPSESLAVANGVIRLRLDTYNPTALTPGDSFWGSEIVSNTIFPRGAGLSFSTRARLVGPIPGGMVASLFSYMTQSGLHDEIDVELLSNDLASPRVLTNVFNNDNFTVPGHPLFATVPGFSLTDFNLYRVDWLSDRVRWWINGILVREDLVNVPDDPMTIRLNLWAPSSTFAAAYNAALQPVDNAGANQTFFYDVDFVEVRDAQ